MRPFGTTHQVFMKDISISFWPWVALLKGVAAPNGCDIANIREDVAVVDPEGRRAMCSERVKKTREFSSP